MKRTTGMARIAAVCLCAAVSSGSAPRAGMGQVLQASTTPTSAAGRIVPDAAFFPVGERLTYAISVGPLRVGSASLQVEATERRDGVVTYRTCLRMHIGAAMLRFERFLVSWIEPRPFRSRGFVTRDPDDGDLLRVYRFEPESGRSSVERRTQDGEFVEAVPHEGEIPVDVLDELAALYLLRTLSLPEGETRVLDRYFDADVAPMEVTALGRERLRVPAGRFDVTVYGAVMPAMPALTPESDARIYVSDDDARLIVMSEAKTPVGHVRVYLTDYEVRAGSGG